MKNIMKMALTRKFVAIALFGFFSQFSMAQDQAVFGALQEIAGIVASISHVPSDADKAALADISDNNRLPQGIRMMAGVVSSINHSPSDQGKEMMARIRAADQAPEQIKSLARIIANFNHMPSDEEKVTLAQLFP